MAGNGRKWLEIARMAGNGWKGVEMAGFAGLGWKWLEIAESGLKWLDMTGMVGMAENG